MSIVVWEGEGLGVRLRGEGEPGREADEALVEDGDTRFIGDGGLEPEGETSSRVLSGPCETIGTERWEGSSSESDSSSHCPLVLGRKGVAGGRPLSVPNEDGGA